MKFPFRNKKFQLLKPLPFLGFLFAVLFITSYIPGIYFFLGQGDTTLFSLGMRSVFIAMTPVLFLPLIYWVSVRKPIFKNWKNILLHIGLSTLFSFLFLIIFQVMIWYYFRGEYLFALEFDRTTEILFRQYITIGSLLFFTYWGLVVLLGLDKYYRELEDIRQRSNKLQTQLELATLSSLRAQLKPHFLFNTLSMIDQMIQKNPSEAVATVDKLEKLLQSTFDRTTSDSCTLKEEIDFIQKYLDIEKSRFPDRLEVVYTISPDTKRIEIPRYLLQPLVENALVHGVAKTMGRCKITIKSVLSKGRLVLSVEDDGPGPARRKKSNEKKGIGLTNIRERLALYFGEHTELNLKKSASGGTVAEILISEKYLEYDRVLELEMQNGQYTCNNL